jgi:hypothetical protein
MIKFWVDLCIGLVPTSGHIKIMDRNASNPHCGNTCLFVATKAGFLDLFERKPGGNRYPMPALLPANMKVGQAHLGKGSSWELAIAALYFLQAQNIGAMVFNEALYQPCAQANRVNVPSGN